MERIQSESLRSSRPGILNLARAYAASVPITSAQKRGTDGDNSAGDQILAKGAGEKRVSVMFKSRRERKPQWWHGKLVHFTLQRNRQHPVNRRQGEERREADERISEQWSAGSSLPIAKCPICFRLSDELARGSMCERYAGSSIISPESPSILNLTS